MNHLPIRDLRPNVGDRIYLRDKEVECTVIAHDPRDNIHPYMVGFSKEEKGVAVKAGMSDNSLTGGPADPRSMRGCLRIANLLQFVFNEWVHGSTMCAMVHAQGGMKCAGRFCGVYVQYATPNQKDGSFLCYPCRQRPSYMTQQTKE